MHHDPVIARRSLLCLPASNTKAIAKLATLGCDAVIFDLEDAVAPDARPQARENLKQHFAAVPTDPRERMIRINALDTTDGSADLQTALEIAPDVILLPKAEEPEHIQTLVDRLDETGNTKTTLWAMIETPKGVLNAAAIARAGHTPNGRLRGFIVGLNDLRKATKVPYQQDRSVLHPWLMQIVLAARAYGLGVIDAVSNNFRDVEHFAAECAEGRSMGFDGKMLIHPAQIAPANAAFAPTEAEVEEARAIVAAFSTPEAAGQGAINIDGRMVERLHLDDAEKLLAYVDAIQQRNSQ
ncbi:CoA ester lyase [Rhizobium sp. L1K21]|uniref:HpcH/HpaI aldolase/citrate lyase family protein n=1 Tax=Rhizobium sp. L1K21 TaxID=2954933 RepID=UPI002092C551|nr:CoA ester lyase [Rhizobium sp. L1K21]MCO6184867.1 CoA ester lyase [Rhizobium sp. L1K21]